jgi:hypothetical protein
MMEWSGEALVAVLEETGRIEDGVLAPYALREVHEHEADATTAGRISGLNRGPDAASSSLISPFSAQILCLNFRLFKQKNGPT